MIDWLVIDKDTTVDYMEFPVGAKGELFIEQDATGFHDVILADNNLGTVEIGKQPGVITKLEWSRSPGRCFWISQVVTPELIFNQPEAINDLRPYMVDSRGIELRWTARMGNPPYTDRPADKYNVYLSEGEITGTDFANIPLYKQSMVPKEPGTLESLILTGLKPGHRYYIAVTAVTTIYGKTKESLISNIVDATTMDVFTGNTNVPQIIPIDPDKMFSDGIVYDNGGVDDPELPILSFENMADLAGIIEVDGVPTGEPSNGGVSIFQYGTSDPTFYNHLSFDLTINLDGTWNISHFWLLYGRDTAFDLQTSIDGTNFTTTASFVSTPENKDVWVEIPANPASASGVKFLRVAFKAMTANFKALIPYGNRTELNVIGGAKYKRFTPNWTASERIGTNAFPLENSDMVEKVAKHQRIYGEPDWLIEDAHSSARPAETPAPSVDDVGYKYETASVWNWDAKMTEFTSKGIKQILCVNNSFPYLRTVGETPIDPTLTKPLDPGLSHTDLAVSTNPQNYKHLARWAYNWAARYGTNTEVPDTYLQVGPGEVIKKGLGVCQYMEFGNEKDAYFRGQYNHWSPEESAAIMSAVYDGHMGTMGEGFGCKAADPNYKVMMNSLAAGGNYPWLEKMRRWWDVNRAPGDYPIDVINYHHYNTTGGSQSVDVWGTTYSAGERPEISECIPVFTHWQKYRDQFMPNIAIFCTEIGYDEQQGGVLSPNYPTQFLRSRHKAYWCLRTFLIGLRHGQDAINHFWYANTEVRLEDLAPGQNYRDLFITCGITDGILAYNDWNRKPLMSYWYFEVWHKIFAGYRFLYPLVEAGQVLCDEYQIATAHPDLWAHAYSNGTDTFIVLWLGSAEMATYDFKVYVDNTEGSVDVLVIDEAEIRQTTLPDTQTVTTDQDGSGKFINLTVGECPVVVKTKNISKEKLIAPNKVAVQALSTEAIKISWTDENIGNNNTIVYQSLSAGGTFNPIHNAYIDNGELIVEGLAEGQTYYFKVGFSKGTVLSDVTDAVSIRTQVTIERPNPLSIFDTGSNYVEILWTYSQQDQEQIDSFEIWRSVEAAGDYVLVDTVAADVRRYKNVGLVPDNTYYYLVRARKDFTTSIFSPIATGETTSVDVTVPEVVTASSNYPGTKVRLRFNTAMENPSGQQAAFSLVQTLSGNSSSIVINSLELDAVDPKVIYLNLGAMIQGSAYTLALSYNNSNGVVRSATGVVAASFTNKVVTNNKDKSAMVSRVVKLSFVPAGSEPVTGWNNIILPTGASVPSSEQAYTQNLYDYFNDEASNIAFIAASHPDDGTAWGGIVEEVQPVTNDSKFPVDTTTFGVPIANYTWGSKTRMMFLNLDPNKEYNIRVLTSTNIYNVDERRLYYKEWLQPAATTGDFKSIIIPGGGSAYVTSLRTSNTLLNTKSPGQGGYPVVAGVDGPKVGIDIAYTELGLWVTGIILEEITPE